jgi:DDE superfamily endonuclease
MEVVLELYSSEHSEDAPLICMDEAAYQLQSDLYPPIEMKPGQDKKEDYHYEREGMQALFMFFDPNRGWRRVSHRDSRTSIDWAEEVRQLLDIDHLVISPLLTLASLYDEPFFVTTEPEVELLLEDRDELLRGRIDTLIIQQQLWVLVVESKSTIAFSVALPQALTYMMGNPNPQRPVYGLITNGDEFQFIKLLVRDNPQYDLSNIFSLLLPHRNQLYDIMRVLKQIRQIMLQD